MVPMITIEQALAYWVKEKKLTKKKAMELVDSLPPGLIAEERNEDMSHRAISIFSAVGAILVGLGVILFVGSNWSVLTPVMKVAILMAGMVTTGVAGYYFAFETGKYEKSGLALLFVNILIFGAGIFLVAQIYHLPLTFWWGALLWFLGTLLFAVILQSRLHLWTSVPLLILFLGWLRSSMVGGSGEFDFLFQSNYSILTMLPVIGTGLVSAGLLLPRWKYMRFGAKTLFHWGIFLVTLVVVISTIDKEVFFPFLRFQQDTLNIVMAVAAAALLCLAFLYGRFETAQGKWGLLALGLYVTFIYILAYLPVLRGFPEGYTGTTYVDFATTAQTISTFQLLYAVHVLLAFVFFLVIIWYGTQLRLPVLINTGMFAVAVAIFIQYFSWALQMRYRSVAFILGGLLIMMMGAILERQRRKVLTSIGK
ncbi:MAG: hypothetical protein JWM56_1253 [Candidatus Peribacteria bacterium]|nr:hypothetical protein [Candidatus Peribacteria bacterium]